MALSKLEIQQMLREMNVKFQVDETYESLKQRLQQENHSLWLKSVSGNRPKGDGTRTPVVRKRKKELPPQDRTTDASGVLAKVKPREIPARRDTSDRRRQPEPAYPHQPIEKPAPGQPWKSAADGTEPFNRKKRVFESVVRRAKMRCERCGVKSGENGDIFELEPYHILPSSQGGEHSIKNVVALCPDCREAMEKDPSPNEVKDLKRKTRSKLYDSLQVVRKKHTRQRRRFSSSRKVTTTPKA